MSDLECICISIPISILISKQSLSWSMTHFVLALDIAVCPLAERMMLLRWKEAVPVCLSLGARQHLSLMWYLAQIVTCKRCRLHTVCTAGCHR